MEFGEQLTMLIVLIVVLGLAYMGVTFWSKKNKAAQIAGGAASPKDGSAGQKDFLLEEIEEERPKPKSQKGDLQQRFQLQGRDAEVAAKVLKRMLKKDQPKDRHE
ncbi:MAG: hypothetical protein O2954_09500 [bacterium]|nr:hypothetical protein [bacterium]